ncbi:MAG: hypothetical protein M1544_01065 [Candidatus Marsarchaeota archaeon]|nr:hypothetical protein [Candidatus Marsarchaeota archaeon]
MISLFRALRHRRLERFLEIDAKNARPVAIIKESPSSYRFVWADENKDVPH